LYCEVCLLFGHIPLVLLSSSQFLNRRRDYDFFFLFKTLKKKPKNEQNIIGQPRGPRP
jgi:hypothetical protein